MHNTLVAFVWLFSPVLFWNVPLKRMPVKRRTHIGCICLSSNLVPFTPSYHLQTCGSCRLFLTNRRKSGSVPTSIWRALTFFFRVRNFDLNAFKFVFCFLFCVFTIIGSFNLSAILLCLANLPTAWSKKLFLPFLIAKSKLGFYRTQVSRLRFSQTDTPFADLTDVTLAD